MYSKDTKVLAHENFTTEALADCIRDDPRPFAQALLFAFVASKVEIPTGVVESIRRAATDANAQVTVDTQVYLAGTGFLDLVVTVFLAGQPSGQVWIESKIGAPIGERGKVDIDEASQGVARTQLDAYREAMTRSGAGPPKALVLIARSQHESANVPWLPWSHLLATVRRSRSSAAVWFDLTLFLEETGVTDDSELSITAREAGALSDAASLFRKVARILVPIDSALGTIGFPAWGSLVKASDGLSYSLRASGHLTLTNGGGRGNNMSGWVEYGLVDDLGGDPEWVFAAKGRTDTFASDIGALVSAADRAVQGVWHLSHDFGPVLQARVRFVDCHEHAAVVSWLHTRLMELQALRVTDLLLADRETVTAS